MPTLYEWEQALHVQRHVRVESSDAVLQEIQGKQRARAAELHARGRVSTAKPTLTTYTPFTPYRDVYIRPIDLLHAIGQTTTPAVPNLADICSWWAYYRYLWAFAIPGSPRASLRLSREAKEIDFHQKGLLSDELGVGVAAYLMATYCNAPQSLDVDVALRRQRLPVTQLNDESPDYIFFDAAQSTFFVVECKGTQTSRANAMKQLCRGTEQVPSLQFTDGTTATGLVIATHVSEYATNVYVLDPPADEEEGRSRSLDADTSKPVEISPNKWEVRDTEAFRRAARVGVQARLLAFAGDDTGAVAKLRQIVDIGAEPPLPARRQQSIRETDEGEFVGTVEILPTRDAVRLEVFHGMARPLFDSSVTGNDERFQAEATAFNQRVRSRVQDESSAFSSLVASGEDEVTASSISSEGTMLQIRVTAR